MKASYYLRAQNFAAPSVNNDDCNKNDNHHGTRKSNGHWYNNDENGIACTNNIMFDSRVCRGNTYATPVFTEDQRRHQEVYKRTQQARRSMIEKRKRDKDKRPTTPPPVEGRVHVMVQTDGTLEDVLYNSNGVLLVDYTSENDDGMKSLDSMIPEGDEISSNDDDISRSSYDENGLEDEKNGKELSKTVSNDNETEINRWDNENDENNEILTKNLAKLIYDEAKNDAICRIQRERSYCSDSESHYR